MAVKERLTLRCTFCGKDHTAVAKLIAGPGVYICNGCVGLCQDILERERETPAKPPSLPEWASLSDDELLQRIPALQRRRPTSKRGCATASPNWVTAAFRGHVSVRRWV